VADDTLWSNIRGSQSQISADLLSLLGWDLTAELYSFCYSDGNSMNQ